MLIVYSVRDRDSFEALDTWQSIVSGISYRATSILVATQQDLTMQEHKITSHEGKEWAIKHNIPFVEVSARIGQGIPQLKEHIIRISLDNERRAKHL